MKNEGNLFIYVLFAGVLATALAFLGVQYWADDGLRTLATVLVLAGPPVLLTAVAAIIMLVVGLTQKEPTGYRLNLTELLMPVGMALVAGVTMSIAGGGLGWVIMRAGN